MACWNCSCSFCSCSASCNELAVIRPALSIDSPLRIHPRTWDTSKNNAQLFYAFINLLWSSWFFYTSNWRVTFSQFYWPRAGQMCSYRFIFVSLTQHAPLLCECQVTMPLKLCYKNDDATQVWLFQPERVNDSIAPEAEEVWVAKYKRSPPFHLDATTLLKNNSTHGSGTSLTWMQDIHLSQNKHS